MFRKNSKVQWSWLGRAVRGVVEEAFKESVTKTIKKKKITRHGSKSNPVYLVRSEAGNEALKLESELKKLTKDTAKTAVKATVKSRAKSSPKMFA